MPLIHRDICHRCPFKSDKDLQRCKKTNCRFVDNWFVKDLEERIINMQIEINTLNSYIEELINADC